MMSAPSRKLHLAALACAVALAVAACTAFSGMDQSPTSSAGGADSGVDATMQLGEVGSDAAAVMVIVVDMSDAGGTMPVVDAGADGSFLQPMDAGSDAGGMGNQSNPGFYFGCGKATVSDCSLCPGAPVDCVLCKPGYYGTFCVQAGSACINYATNGFGWCGCAAPSAAACPIKQQTCYPGSAAKNACISCGENGSGGLECKSGGACSESKATCQ